MTYYDICARLAAAGIDDPQTDATVLICHFCGISQASLMARRGDDFDTPALADAVARRETHYPLQYLIGTWGFCGQVYEVNEHTLIPRPDTETLVELAVRLLPHGARFADLCTGSGCIAISTLCMRHDTTALGIDLFPETLAVAERNGCRNGVDDRVSWLCADVLAPLPNEVGQFDAILSNPPYIRSDVVLTLAPELTHEPSAALDGGEDGLIFYRAILREHLPRLRPGGMVLFEIGYDQGAELTALAETHGCDCRIVRDLGGQDRVAIVTPR